MCWCVILYRTSMHGSFPFAFLHIALHEICLVLLHLAVLPTHWVVQCFPSCKLVGIFRKGVVEFYKVTPSFSAFYYWCGVLHFFRRRLRSDSVQRSKARVRLPWINASPSSQFRGRRFCWRISIANYVCAVLVEIHRTCRRNVVIYCACPCYCHYEEVTNDLESKIDVMISFLSVVS